MGRNCTAMITKPHPETKSHYAYQSCKMMMTLMILVLRRQEFPSYNPLKFFPPDFTKRRFSDWIKENNLDPESVVSVFTKQQLTFVNGVLTIQAGERKFINILHCLPADWKHVIESFKDEAGKIASSDKDVHKAISVSGIQATVRLITPFL